MSQHVVRFNDQLRTTACRRNSSTVLVYSARQAANVPITEIETNPQHSLLLRMMRRRSAAAEAAAVVHDLGRVRARSGGGSMTFIFNYASILHKLISSCNEFVFGDASVPISRSWVTKWYA